MPKRSAVVKDDIAFLDLMVDLLAEFGSLLRLFYPGPGFTPFSVYSDFRTVLSSNPC